MTAAAAIARRKSTAASLSSATDGAARPEAASATADEATHRDPHAAGAQFASTAAGIATAALDRWLKRSEEHTSELQSLMRNSYAVFCLKQTNNKINPTN